MWVWNQRIFIRRQTYWINTMIGPHCFGGHQPLKSTEKPSPGLSGSSQPRPLKSWLEALLSGQPVATTWLQYHGRPFSSGGTAPLELLPRKMQQDPRWLSQRLQDFHCNQSMGRHFMVVCCPWLLLKGQILSNLPALMRKQGVHYILQ